MSTTAPDNARPASAAERIAATARGVFFIVGCGRSGTTLLQSALSAHPDVIIPPETRFYPVFGSRPETGSIEARLEEVSRHLDQRGIKVNPETLDELARAADPDWDGMLLAVLSAYAEEHHATRVGEKSPMHTPYVGRIADAHADAKFIHIIRDPRAVVLSRLKAGFAAPFMGLHIERWLDAYRMHEKEGPRLGAERYLAVQYESLVTDLEPTLHRVCRFLDLPFSADMLEPHKRPDKGFPKRSEKWMQNTLKPVFTSSVEKWRNELPRRQIAVIEAILHRQMEALGYEPTNARTLFPRTQCGGSWLIGWTFLKSRRLVRRLLRRRASTDPESGADASTA